MIPPESAAASPAGKLARRAQSTGRCAGAGRIRFAAVDFLSALLSTAAPLSVAALLSMTGCADAPRSASARSVSTAGAIGQGNGGLGGSDRRDDSIIAVNRLPGWQNDDLDGLHRALRRQCALARPPNPWPDLCAQLPAADGLRAWIEERFVARPLPSGYARDGGEAGRPRSEGPAPDDGSARASRRSAPARDGLLTGYYEPLLRGTRARADARQTPVYGRPADLVTGADGARLRRRADGRLSGYPDRAWIETQGLPQAPVLCWLDDPVEAFFLHVQGSGRVLLPDGSVLHLGFADHNGQRYHAIGRELIRRGEIEAQAVTAQSIRDWLRAHPGQMREILHSNPRYIFFRELPARSSDTGPPGSLGVALEPGRSVAADPAYVPTGALLYLDSTRPDGAAPLQRAVVAQDRGAAITGAVRADLFWGSGDEAGRLAGLTRQPLRLWLLSPRENGAPSR